MDKLINSVHLLGAFSKETGFKYLTHRFDAESDDFIDTVNRCRYSLLDSKDRIPSHLYKLLCGFLFGPNWTDSNGIIHTDFCGCDKWIDWCLDNPGVHPMDAFYDEIERLEEEIESVQHQITVIREQKITAENIYEFLYLYDIIYQIRTLWVMIRASAHDRDTGGSYEPENRYDESWLSQEPVRRRAYARKAARSGI